MASINVLDLAYDRDTSQLRTILPDGVWLLVADVLTYQADLENFSNSSQYFRGLIKSRTVKFLFAKVWNIMEGNYIKAQIHYSFPDSKTILKLRHVSKDFKQAVDDYYLQKTLHCHEDGQVSDFEQEFVQAPGRLQREHTKLMSFLTHFKDTHENNKSLTSPFVSRSVTFRFWPINNETTPEFVTNISLLLRIYGYHLQKCSFRMCGLQMQHSQLREWLQYLPNLKFLQISGWLNYNMSQLLGNPLPRFENLDHLSVVNSTFPICAHLLKVNNHITSLEITYDEISGPVNIFCEKLPNLTKLMLNIKIDFEFTQLKAATFSPNFNTLEIIFSTDIAKFPAQELFTVVGKNWANTLTSFSLKTNVLVNSSTCKHRTQVVNDFLQRVGELQKTNLPHVTKLTIDAQLIPYTGNLSILRT